MANAAALPRTFDTCPRCKASGRVRVLAPLRDRMLEDFFHANLGYDADDEELILETFWCPACRTGGVVDVLSAEEAIQSGGGCLEWRWPTGYVVPHLFVSGDAP